MGGTKGGSGSIRQNRKDFTATSGNCWQIKGQAVLQEIAKAEGFSYTDEDVDQTIAAMAMSYQMPAEQLREMMGERGVAMVAEDILSKQALEFIVKEAVEA